MESRLDRWFFLCVSASPRGDSIDLEGMGMTAVPHRRDWERSRDSRAPRHQGRKILGRDACTQQVPQTNGAHGHDGSP